IGESGSAARRGRKSPPTPGSPYFLRQFVVGMDKVTWMPHRIRRLHSEQVGNSRTVLDTDNKEALARLRHEMSGIDDQRAKFIAALDERCSNRRKILPIMRPERSANILQHHNFRGTVFLIQARQKMPKIPEGSGALALQACSSSSQRQVLAREGCPCQVGPFRNVARG